MPIARAGRSIFFLGGLIFGVLTGCFLSSLVNEHQRQLQAAHELLLRSRALNLVLQKKIGDYKVEEIVACI